MIYAWINALTEISFWNLSTEKVRVSNSECLKFSANVAQFTTNDQFWFYILAVLYIQT